MRHQGRYLLTSTEAPAAGEAVVLEGREARHVLLVRRARPGDRLELFNGKGRAWEAELVSGADERASCRVLRELPPAPGARWRLSLATAVPRPRRMTFLVEKCAELGVDELLPVAWGRSARSGSGKAVERWRRLAESAAKQSRRTKLMHVAEPLPADGLVGLLSGFDRVLHLDTSGDMSPREALAGLAAGARLLALIGPEGGLSEEDLAAIGSAAGDRLLRVGLGPGVLRVETAVVAVASIVLAEGLLDG